ncbi:MAG: OmpP1/FadL family transporter [Kiritimatiellia bacterium]
MTVSKEIVLISAISVSMIGFAAGFGLYEGSARGNAMGGGVMGKALDAGANFYNPATLSDLTGTVVTVGMTTEHPSADTYVDGHKGLKMDSGCFVLPHVYIAQELPYDFSFGLGFAPEYGLGSHYYQNWPLSWDTRETTIMGLTLNPNLAYKVTDDWSISAGFRLMYFSFDQYSDKMATQDGENYGTVRDHLKGDNGMLDWGWQISTKYNITEKLSAGVMYKSYIDTKVKGYNHTRVRGYDDSAVAAQVDKGVRAALASNGLTPAHPMYQQLYNQYYGQAYPAAVAKAHDQVDSGARSADGDASCSLRLPQSLSMGLNYDATDKFHLGVAATWTQWSCIDNLHFDLPGDNDRDVPLKWNDSWRIGFGAAYDLTDELTLMMSYVYDQDPCSKYHGTTMLPPGDRQIGTIGLGYALGPVDLVVSYGLVFMQGDSLGLTDDVGRRYKFETKNGLSHAVAVSMTYQF